MKLHETNDKPATPIHEVQKWGTEKQVSDFIEDVWPVNWTKEVFDHYVSTIEKGGEKEPLPKGKITIRWVQSRARYQAHVGGRYVLASGEDDNEVLANLEFNYDCDLHYDEELDRMIDLGPRLPHNKTQGGTE